MVASISLLRDCILWGIEGCANEHEMARWWKAHQPALKALRRRDAEGFAAVIEAKDRHRAAGSAVALLDEPAEIEQEVD